MAAKIERDARYSIRREWCGKAEQQFVVRFCGEFVSSHLAKSDAVKAATAHDCARTSARQLVEFIDGYMAALLWSSTDTTDGGETVNLDEYEISTAAADRCRADCFAFFSTNRADIDAAAAHYASADGATGYQMAGHDFALTRNHHGAGFWDGDLPERLGARLTKASEAAGSCDLYLGDDGEVHAL